MGSRCSSWKTSDHSDDMASLILDTNGSSTSSAGGTMADLACAMAWMRRLGQPWVIGRLGHRGGKNTKKKRTLI